MPGNSHSKSLFYDGPLAWEPVPGSRKPERLQENLKVAEIILSAEEINEIDEKLNQMQILAFDGNQAK